MATIDSKLATLRRKAAANDVEVEHLTQFAVLGNPIAIPVIRELTAKHGWPRSNCVGDAHVAPLARWAEVVCTFLEGGCDALVEYARKPEPKSLYFAVSVLEQVKSAAAVLALAELADDIVRASPERTEDALKLASAINLALSFKNPPRVQPNTAAQLRTFLHGLFRLDLSEPQRAVIVCALRGVGDDESIRLIDQLPRFSGPWTGLESLARKAIHKRIRNT